MSNDVPFVRKETSKDWAAIRGEMLAVLVGVIFVGLIVIGLEVVSSVRELTKSVERLNQRSNADSRIIQLAILQVDPERKKDIDAILREHGLPEQQQP